MEQKRSEFKPEMVTKKRNRFNQVYYVIAFNVSRDPETMDYLYNEVTIPPDKVSLGGIVDIMITAEYPNDRMQACQNNYLLDPTNEVYKTAFNEMQDWRTKSKEWAKEAMAIIEQ